jgi:LacI family transcriptional regulator
MHHDDQVNSKRGRKPRQGGRRPTMTDIARLAGVSQSSVSLVLNNMSGARIAESTRRRILEAAQAIGYRLQTRRIEAGEGQPKIIAYLVDEISTSPHPVVSVDGARDAAWEVGHLISVHVTRANPDLEAATLRALQVDNALLGVIYSTIFTRKVTLPPELQNLPTVLLNCYTSQKQQPSVIPSEVAGGFTATEFLLQHGHRRIGLINGEPWMDASRDRLKGYRQALATADVAFDSELVLNGDWMPDTGYRRTYELLRLKRPPTALFCANDLMAVGAMEALAELGIDVPGEISVIGYDDQEIARYTRPALSTCILPSYDMGRWAAETLIDMAAQGGGMRTVQLKMDCPLVSRRSVGAPCSDIAAVVARTADRIFHGPTSKPVHRSFSWSSLMQEVTSPA